ncbi:MAG TPA: thiolase family protein [Gaiellaceae bacterium]|nr:thiolase family protein [Gaiellaceae bacterium]
MAVEARIVGTGETPYLRHPGGDVTTTRLLAAAAREALDDAGLAPGEIDGLGVASFSLAPDRGVDLAFRLGLSLRWLMDAATGGASALDLLQHARRAVEAGDARAVLLVAGDRLDPPAFARLVDDYNSATRDHLTPIPTGGPNALFATLTRRHMAARGLDRDAYGRLVVAQRAWAGGNPNAAYREPLTLDRYRAGPLVADPLTIYDCVPVVAGADAVVVAAAGSRGVRVRGLVSSYNADHQDGDGFPTALAELRADLWDAAGLGPEDVDVVSVYDDYPAVALVQLEDLGFASDGDLAGLVERIAARALPVNTAGGQLSAGQAGAAGGMHGLVEVVRQLRGAAGDRQVEGARAALVTGYGMVAYRYGACANAAVLEAAE